MMFGTKGSRARALSRRRLPMLESLDSRALPSASPLGVCIPAVAPLGPAAPPAWRDTFYIKGTQVQFNSLGLPSTMSGDIYPTAQMTGLPIGHYQETLQPVLVGGQLAGTTGVTTFTFGITMPGSSNPGITLETIKATDTSMITGVTSTGALAVQSVGTVVGASGIAPFLSGGFTSASTVALGPSFSMSTAVNLGVTPTWGPWSSQAVPTSSACDPVVIATTAEQILGALGQQQSSNLL
jgi:hypothetical protein